MLFDAPPMATRSFLIDSFVDMSVTSTRADANLPRAVVHHIKVPSNGPISTDTFSMELSSAIESLHASMKSIASSSVLHH